MHERPLTSAPPQSGESRPPWRAVALPAEHGGWGLLGEPLVLGLVLGPSLAAGALSLATVAAFLARHPLRLALLDRRKGSRYPRTLAAERVFTAYGALALGFLAAALALAHSPFWTALVAAAPAALVALLHDAWGRSREALAESAGAVALAASASAIALASGVAPALAWGAGGLLALRAVVSILYVRARIRLDRGTAAAPGTAIAAHGLALASATALALAGLAPGLAVLAFALLLARAAWGLSPLRRPVRPKALGFQELAYGLATLALLAAGYRLVG